MAILIGKPPADFSLAALPLTTPPPPIPAGLPSELLERRPDIAAAERRMASANAQIGVAKAAYYPTISLGATGGFESGVITTLISGPSALWSAGGSAIAPIFDAGRRRANVDQAIAAYDQTVANYRETVLTGFQQVEDNLAGVAHSGARSTGSGKCSRRRAKVSGTCQHPLHRWRHELPGSDHRSECSALGRTHRRKHSWPPHGGCSHAGAGPRWRMGSFFFARPP